MHQEQIDRANAVNLVDFLKSQGEQLEKSGQEYRWKLHDSLTVRDNKWFRHSQAKGGYPIAFVMEFYGKTFPEAVKMLICEDGKEKKGCVECSHPSDEFRLPARSGTNKNVIRYLTEERNLDKSLVEAFLLNGDIYEEAEHHNAVFVGRDKRGIARYTHIKGTNNSFRQDAAGSDKSCGFSYHGTGGHLFVFEAPIDLMSFICLYPDKWQTRSYCSLGGVSGKAMESILFHGVFSFGDAEN